MTAYPLDLERPGLLRDGRSILIRPASPDDADVVLGFNGRLTADHCDPLARSDHHDGPRRCGSAWSPTTTTTGWSCWRRSTTT